MPLRPLNLADGQLAAASATILGADTDISGVSIIQAATGQAIGNHRIVDVRFYNTSYGATQTVFLYLTPSGSVARMIGRVEILPLQAWAYLGIGLAPADILSAYASDPATVDYLISRSTGVEEYGNLVGGGRLDNYGIPLQRHASGGDDELLLKIA